MGTVEEIAHSVVYLCESEWTTGTILTIDGGMTSRSNMPIRPKPAKPESQPTTGNSNDSKANGEPENVMKSECIGATFES